MSRLPLVVVLILTTAGDLGAQQQGRGRLRSVVAAGKHLGLAKGHQIRHWIKARRAKRRITRSKKRLAAIGRPVHGEIHLWSKNLESRHHHLKQASRELRKLRNVPLLQRLRAKVVRAAKKTHPVVQENHIGFSKPGKAGFVLAMQRLWKNGRLDSPVIAINLSSVAAKQSKHFFLSDLAHESRHVWQGWVADKQINKLMREFHQPGISPAQKQAKGRELNQYVAAVNNKANREVDAFGDQAYVMGKLGKAWREPWLTRPSTVYPPQRINAEVIKRYVGGVAESLNTSYDKASPNKRRLAAEYLKGYQQQMQASANAAVGSFTTAAAQPMARAMMPPQMSLAPDGKLDRSGGSIRNLLRRQGARLKRTASLARGALDQRHRNVGAPKSAFEAGVHDATLMLRPHPRLKTILR